MADQQGIHVVSNFDMNSLINEESVGTFPLLADDLFGLSPLSSPDPSPTNSPKLSPTELPPANNLFSLSPLSSADASPTNSPVMTSVDPATLSSTSAGIPPLDLMNFAAKGPSAPQSRKEVRKERRKEKNKARARKIRQEKRTKQSQGRFAVEARSSAKEKYTTTINPIYTNIDIDHTPPTKASYIGQKTAYDKQVTYSLGDFIGPQAKFDGYTLIKWDGRDSKPVVDSAGRGICVLVSTPQDDDDRNWLKLSERATGLMRDTRDAIMRRVHRRRSNHPAVPRRGNFHTLRCGVSYGGGQMRPANVANTAENIRLLDHLNSSPEFKRISGFVSSAFATWAPKLYQYYVDKMTPLYNQDPSLNRPFPNSVFSTFTYNLGKTVCYPHVDFANLAFGWCSVFSLGNYNHLKGGHLVLMQCRLVIEFPPGSLILFPSATITHANTTVQDHEDRFSFTGYTAGGLFRWVDQGFKTVLQYQSQMNAEGLKLLNEGHSRRWRDGLALLPTFCTSKPNPAPSTPIL